LECTFKMTLKEQDYAQDERREEIKRAALKVFARKGISGTKMSMIAAEAGISQGLSYRYFSSKEELFSLLVQEALEEAQTAIANIGNLPGTPFEQLKALTKNMLEENHKQYFLLIQQAHTSDETPVKVKQLLDQFSSKDTIEQLIPIFVKGQEMGEFCEGDPHRILFLYLSVISGLMIQDVYTDENYWVNEIDSLMKILSK